MKKTTPLKNLHIGKMIEKIAFNKEVPAKKIVGMILRYQKNEKKIYQLDDMDVEDVILISYLLTYNFLQVISEKYLSHLPHIVINPDQESYDIEWDQETRQFSVSGDIGTSNILDNIHIGKHIKKLAEKKGWNEQYMAKLLHCSQSSISDLYRHKSLKVKKLIQISDMLKHNLIEEVYLNRMFIISSSSKFPRRTMTITAQEVRIENLDDKNFSMVFFREGYEK
jgi:predicted XRE-type DNA-binding protein